VLEHTGGDPEREEYEPGLSPAERELEAKARAALRLLEQAAPAGGVVLSADAAAQISDTLRAVYNALGRLEPVSKRDLEAMADLVKALALLKATPPGGEATPND
jgi:hypothetical protein